MYKIAVDGMGGDHAPKVVVEGVLQALDNFSDIEITLFGDEKKLAPYLKEHDRLKVVHTEHYLDMGVENPVKEFRQNKEHSMFKGMNFVKEGHADAFVTAGPTQAVIVGGQLILRKLKGIKRTALAPIIPSYDGKGRILLDAGANLDLRPEHLLDLAIYAQIVAELVLDRKNPTVALVNNGEEETKGRELERETYKLLKADKSVNFFGNLEPTDVFTSDADIFVTDGYTGNIVMKTMEGTAKGLGKVLEREIKSSIISKIGYLFVRKSLKNFAKALDASEIGGAMVIGLNHVLIKAHGSSNNYAISNAIRQARAMVKGDVINRVSQALSEKE